MNLNFNIKNLKTVYNYKKIIVYQNKKENKATY